MSSLVLELTRQLVRFDTVNPPGAERSCAQFLAARLEHAGFEVRTFEHHEQRTSLVARIEGAADTVPLCLTGHLDTVPLGATPWCCDPFAGEVHDGRIYGRGTSDMKGGIAAMVIAATDMAAYVRGSSGLTLVFTASEETGCQGAAYLASSRQALGRAGAMVVAEPTGNYPLLGHRGALWLRARTRGVSAHGSTPHLGVNALYKAAQVVRKLETYRFARTGSVELGAPSLSVGTLRGGHNVNMVPDEAVLEVDVRTLPAQRHAALLTEMRRFLGPEVQVEPMIDLQGLFTDPGDPWVIEVFDLIKERTGERPVPRGAPYFTDASYLSPAYGGVPTIILGPGDAELAHQTDESCSIARLEQSVELYRELISRWSARGRLAAQIKTSAVC